MDTPIFQRSARGTAWRSIITSNGTVLILIARIGFAEGFQSAVSILQRQLNVDTDKRRKSEKETRNDMV